MKFLSSQPITLFVESVPGRAPGQPAFSCFRFCNGSMPSAMRALASLRRPCLRGGNLRIYAQRYLLLDAPHRIALPPPLRAVRLHQKIESTKLGHLVIESSDRRVPYFPVRQGNHARGRDRALSATLRPFSAPFLTFGILDFFAHRGNFFHRIFFKTRATFSPAASGYRVALKVALLLLPLKTHQKSELLQRWEYWIF